MHRGGPSEKQTPANQTRLAAPAFTTNTPILSFFTGLGLLDLGFHHAGFESVWHNEFSVDFIGGFNHAMESFGVSGPAAAIQNSKSIIEVGPNEILREAFGAVARSPNFGASGMR